MDQDNEWKSIMGGGIYSESETDKKYSEMGIRATRLVSENLLHFKFLLRKA